MNNTTKRLAIAFITTAAIFQAGATLAKPVPENSRPENTPQSNREVLRGLEGRSIEKDLSVGDGSFRQERLEREGQEFFIYSDAPNLAVPQEIFINPEYEVGGGVPVLSWE